MFLHKKFAASAVIAGLGIASLALVGVSSANAAPTTANHFVSVSDFTAPALGDATSDLTADDTRSSDSGGDDNYESIYGETDSNTNDNSDDTTEDKPNPAEYDDQNITDDDSTTDTNSNGEESAKTDEGNRILLGISIGLLALAAVLFVARHVVLARISRKH